MSNSILENTEVEIKGWETISFTVTIPDLEQVVIVAPHTWNWQTSSYTSTRKFLVKKLQYEMRGHGNDQIGITSIHGVYFLKGDNRAGIGEKSLYYKSLTKEVIEQIPDNLLKYGRDYLETNLAPRLQNLIKTGIVMGVSNA